MLKITLASGETQEVQFDQASTLTVTNQAFVDGVAGPVTASWSEISELEIVADPAPAVADIPSESPPESPAPTGSLPVDTTLAATEPTSTGSDTAVTVTDAPDGTIVTPGPGADAPVDGSGNPIDPAADITAAPVEPVVDAAPDTSNPQVDALTEPQSVGEALAAADAQATEPTDGAPVVDASGTSHDEAVANAGGAVDAIVSETVPAPLDHLAQAQADLAVALATWPDSEPLLDLKVQLDDLAADAAEKA